MGIQSFLKAQKGDPDWLFTPSKYFDKEFKVIDANLIELAPRKEDKVILRQTPTEKEMLAKQIRIDVREGSTLDIAIINEASPKLQQVFIYEIRIREGGQMNLGMFVKGGMLNKHIIQVVMDAGATFNAYGHAINTDEGDCEIITKIDVQGPQASSNQFFTCEAGKNSQTVYQSMAHIAKDAEYVQLGIENLNLVIGDGGRCHSSPDIFNESDTATIVTGTRTDTLNEDQVYYLQTKGMSKEEAEVMLINLHRSHSINIIQNAEIRDELAQLLVN